MNILNNLRKNALMRKFIPKGPLDPKDDDGTNKVQNKVIDSMKPGDSVEMMKCTIRRCSEEEEKAEEQTTPADHAHEATSIDKQPRGTDASNSDTNIDIDNSASASLMAENARDAKRLAAKENQEFSRFQQQVLTMRIRKRRHHGKQEQGTKGRFTAKGAMPRAHHEGPSKRMRITQPAKKPMLM